MPTTYEIAIGSEYKKIINILNIIEDNINLQLVDNVNLQFVNSTNVNQSNILGTHTLNYRSKQSDIHISLKNNKDLQSVTRTIVHELAHYLWYKHGICHSNYILKELNKAFKYTYHISNYSRTNLAEFFACSFEEYYLNPTQYIILNPFMYNFFKNILNINNNGDMRVFTVEDEHTQIYNYIKKYMPDSLHSNILSKKVFFFFNKNNIIKETLLQYNSRLKNILSNVTSSI